MGDLIRSIKVEEKTGNDINYSVEIKINDKDGNLVDTLNNWTVPRQEITGPIRKIPYFVRRINTYSNSHLVYVCAGKMPYPPPEPGISILKHDTNLPHYNLESILIEEHGNDIYDITIVFKDADLSKIRQTKLFNPESEGPVFGVLYDDNETGGNGSITFTKVYLVKGKEYSIVICKDLDEHPANSTLQEYSSFVFMVD